MELFVMIVGIVAVLIILLTVVIIMLKRLSKRKKLLKYFQEEYLKILKVDALDRAIVSPYDNRTLATGPRKVLVQVHEISDLTDKTYLLDTEQPWIIGRKPGDNTICIRGDKTVSSVHCKLEVYNERLFLVDLGSKNLTYYCSARSKKRQMVHLPQRGSQMLTTGDVFYVGYTAFEVTVYDSNAGIV